MSEYIKYSYEQLKTFCEDCFCHFGFTPDESGIITDVLLMSDLFGIESHGMQRLARYHKGIEKGLIKVDACSRRSGWTDAIFSAAGCRIDGRRYRRLL